jgi:hypothetical protein
MSDYRKWSETDLRSKRNEALADRDFEVAEAIEHELSWRQHRRLANEERRSA